MTPFGSGTAKGRESVLRIVICGAVADGKTPLAGSLAVQLKSHDRYSVTDTRDDERSTRKGITAASAAQLAIVVIDARTGVDTQARRDGYIASVLGIRDAVLAVDGMDAVGYAEGVFRSIEQTYRAFTGRIGLSNVVAIPLSAVTGDNVIAASGNMPWYGGPTLIGHLDSLAIDETTLARPFRLPVERVDRPDAAARGFAGVIVSGTVGMGDEITLMPSAQCAHVARIETGEGEVERAVAAQSVTLTLAEDVHAPHAELIAKPDALPAVSDQFQATLVWMDEEPLLPGRAYLMKIGTAVVTASVTALQYKVDMNTLERIAAKQLLPDEIAVCNLATDRPVAFDAYTDNRGTGGFILIDRFSNHTAGAGMIRFGLRRADNVHWQAVDVLKHARAAAKSQKPCVLWFTGLSGAGKSTIANLVEKRLHVLGRHTYLLDGDNVRHGLNRDLGFTDADRVENIRRIGEVARLMVDAGLIVLVSFISPFRAERRMARELLEPGEFVEIFVDTSLEEAERRDPKGLYRKARRGELPHFTGVDSPYEVPEHPEIRIDTSVVSAEEASETVVRFLTASS